jgi:hypothetical protein
MASTDLEDTQVKTRLDWFLARNAETARLKANYRSEIERIEVELMRSPVNAQRSFACFGAMLGGVPLFTVILRVLFERTSTFSGNDIGWLILMMLMANAASITGYYTGKVVGPMALKVELFRWSTMLPLLPLIGFLWGAVAGAGGGLIAFGIGAIPGFLVGGLVGALTVPAFIIVHRLIRSGDSIELKHFLPLSIGIVLMLCAFILSI